MDVAADLREARRRAGLTQTQLAGRTGTSQATISAYESGRKQPSLGTLERLLSATGSRLAILSGARPVVQPSSAQHARVGRELVDVLALAEALPTREGRRLRFAPVAPRVTLPHKLLALHRALAGARVPHAFGGAVALAYWTLAPRGTTDLDVNVFVPVADADGVLSALPEDVARPVVAEQAIGDDGQLRLWWEETPLDLFFDPEPIHAETARRCRTVPFGDGRIRVLGPIELAALKAVSGSTRDWADIEAMLAAGTLDLDAVRAAMRTLLARDDPRFPRLDEAVSHAAAETGGGRRPSL